MPRNRALLLFPHGGSEPALLLADRLHTDVRLLLNTSALPFMRLGNVLPMTGFIWVVAGSSGTFPAISFSAAKVVGKHGRAPCRFSG